MSSNSDHKANFPILFYRNPASSMGPPAAAGVRHAATGALRELTSLGKEREDFSDSNFDEWSGYGGSLFS